MTRTRREFLLEIARRTAYATPLIQTLAAPERVAGQAISPIAMMMMGMGMMMMGMGMGMGMGKGMGMGMRGFLVAPPWSAPPG